MLVLEGAQGSFKSRAAAIMAIRPEWFADEIADVGGKDAAQDLRGKWVIEIAELAAMRRSEIERIKSFVSRSCDHYQAELRPPLRGLSAPVRVHRHDQRRRLSRRPYRRAALLAHARRQDQDREAAS